MKKTAIYVRVSTHDQAEEGYSVSEQVDKLEKYCDIKNWKIYDTYIDPGFTGSNINRPALKKLINDVKRKRVDTVLIYKLDRLSRSQKDTLYLIEDVFISNDVDFVSLNENFDTSTAFGKAMIGILSVFAQLEREQISERMKMGKIGRAKAGKPMSWSRKVFGYDYVDGEYEINDLEASVVERMFYEYLAGMSITKLTDLLNEEGHIGKDIKWSYRTIRQTLDNPIHAGAIRFKGKVYKGNHVPIVTKETFVEVQKELEIRQKEAYENNNNPRPFQAKYMLSGIIRCGHCGAPLESTLGNIRKDGTRSKKYQCTNRVVKKRRVTYYNENKKCDSGFYHMSDLENYVLDQIEKVQLKPELIKNLSSSPEVTDNTENYLKAIDKLDTKISKLSDLYLNDMMTFEKMEEKAKSMQQEKLALESKLELNEKDLSVVKENKAIDYFKNSKVNIKNETYENQAVIAKRLIEKINVTAEEIKINWRL